jgi:hypothetical protein
MLEGGGTRLAALALIACTSGCEGLVPYHTLSAEYEEERTAIVLDTVDAEHASAFAVVLPRDGAQVAVRREPLDFETRIEALVGRIAASASRPPSAWGVKTAGMFYAAPPRVLDSTARGGRGELVEIRPGLRGFRFERWLASERVTTLEFSIEYAEAAFRITLDRITMHYSRAKVADKGWRNWWARIPCIYGFGFDIAALFGMSYGDGAVDVQADLLFTSSWSDADGEHHFAPLAVLGWTVLDVKLGGKPHLVGQSSGWLPLVPPSILDAASVDARFGHGRYTLSALVTEQDDLSPQFIDERNTLGNYVDDILGLLPIPGKPVP